MPRTSEDLTTCCLRDETPELPVIADYFGNASTDYEMSIVFSVYRGLVIKRC